MDALKKLFGGNLRQFGMLFVLVALTLLFQFLTSGKVITPTNMMNLLNGNSYILVLAIGMVMVIVIGHIDLAVGSVAAERLGPAALAAGVNLNTPEEWRALERSGRLDDKLFRP